MSKQSFYIDFFGFSERPFTLVPDPGILYWSKQHKRAYAVMEFGVMSEAPITLITGEVGAGKTTLVQTLLSNLDDDITVGLVSNVHGSRGELLQWVLHALDVRFDPQASYVQLFQQLQDHLLEEYGKGRRVILVFDEAQNISLEGLEEIRMLTNINSNKDVLLQLILVGQPELRAMVQRPELKQMAQRVAASFHLEAMDEDTVANYVRHRLTSVGGTGQEFTDGAIKRIHTETRGVPRLVNQLCEFALLYAWGDDMRQVDAQMLDTIIKDGVFFGASASKEPLILYNKEGG
jgi:type II secretory pathway predicted ATPase ExeA